MSRKNRMYQGLWKRAQNFHPVNRKDLFDPLTGMINIGAYGDRMRGAYSWAVPFGGIKLAIIGDSNAAVMASETDMRQFSKVSVNHGIGGTTPQEWVFFLSTPGGKRFLECFKDVPVRISNCLGNCALRVMGSKDRTLMDTAEGALKQLLALTTTYMPTLPPIHFSLYERFGTPKTVVDQLRKDADRLNKIMKKVAGPLVMDVTPHFAGPDGEARPGLLMDTVHWSQMSQDALIKVFDVLPEVPAL